MGHFQQSDAPSASSGLPTEGRPQQNGSAEGPQSEVEHLRHEIARLLDIQDQTRVARDAFLSNTTHELKTPLNAIIGYCDLMLAEVEGPIDNAQYKEYLKAIKEGGEKLSSVVGELLNVARHESGKVALKEDYVAVHDLVNAAIRLAVKRDDQVAQSVKADIQARLPSVYVDERALIQALVNVIDNAVKFSSPGDVITVSASQNSQDQVVFSVKDTGCGIEEDKVKEITAPFYFVEDVLTRTTSGLGTGLSVTSRIADLHGATLAIESKLGVGTVVSITLPAFRNEVLNQSEDETVFFGTPTAAANLETLLKINNSGFERVFYAGCGKILIGRNRNTPPLVGCDIVVDDKRVSRPHATVSYENGSFIFRDESRSGSHVMVNEADIVSLKHGDCFTLEGAGKIYLGDNPLKGDAPVIEFCVESGA